MPYITDHAVERYMDRWNGVTRRHAIEQLKGMWPIAQRGKQQIDGAVHYKVCDLTMVYHETNDSIVTVW